MKIVFAICFLFVFITAANSESSLKIVSLAPSITEIICTLNAGENLVGITNDCNYPDQINNTQRVGSFLNPNIEKIISLKPNIVFGIKNNLNLNFVKLDQLGIKTFLYNSPQSIEGLYELIKEIGLVLAKQKTAENCISKLKKELILIMLKPEILK